MEAVRSVFVLIRSVLGEENIEVREDIYA